MSRLVEEKLLEPGEQRKLLDDPAHPRVAAAPAKRAGVRIVWIALLLLVLIAAMFLAGYLPRRKREQSINRDAKAEENSIPEVNVARVKRSVSTAELLLPGSMSALNEAFIYARAAGYVKKRYVGLGDHVTAGQIMAEIEEPDLDQQVIQARASVAQAQGSLGQTQAAVEQAQAQLHLQDITVRRIDSLVEQGVFAKQQGDQAHADHQNAAALLKVSEANVRASRANVSAVEANLARLIELQGYEKIRAPFTGIVTGRSVDVGMLISPTGSAQGMPVTSTVAGGASGELFRVAQVNIMRILVNVPQGYAPEVRLATPADAILQGSLRRYPGKVTHTAQSIDQQTRTMLTEVQVPNTDGSLLPGMYTNIQFRTLRSDPPLLIPGDSLVARTKGPVVALLSADNHVHYESVTVGRDYGTDLEITSGLKEGDRVVINPSDDVREGEEVKPAAVKKAAAGPAGNPSQPKK